MDKEQPAIPEIEATPTRDEPGLRGLHLAQAIIHCTKMMWPTPDVVNLERLYEHWGAEIVRLCSEHFAEADRAIQQLFQQLFRNAAEMAMMTPRRKLVYDPTTGRISGEPASVPGERE